MKEIEILSLNNIKKPLKSHFHNYYVIGFLEKGCRKMICNDTEYILTPGDTVIFNPFDVHSCKNFDNEFMRYFAVNMEKTFIETLFEGKLPNFKNVIKSSNLFYPFYESLQDKNQYAKILKNLPHSFESYDKNPAPEIEKVCKIIEQNLSNKITLEFLSASAGLSKSAFLRAFTRQKGITPCRYVENLRIDKAKTLLLKGIPLLEIAFAAGFSSQSHFINSFKSITGLAPGVFRKEVKCL